ncbi:MAG: hypothetical protein CHACPFDD_02398 [Phycisphaerae bacterium]|nr:hypothetical protein [Phycisphaerae bacterium]
MPRPKDRPVLFEVVKREEMNRGAEARPPGPSPWRSLLSATSRLVRPGASETPTEPRTPDEPAQRTDGPAPAASRTDAPTSRSTAAVSAPARPSLTPRAVAAPRASGAADASRVRSPLRYAAGRFQLEFGWIGLSGALLALLLLLLVAFQAGARFAGGSPAGAADGKLEAARAAPPNESVTHLPEAERRPAGRRIATPPRNDDKARRPAVSAERRANESAERKPPEKPEDKSAAPAEKPAATPDPGAPNAPAEPPRASDATAGPPAATADVSESAVRERGYHYLIVQHFPKSKLDQAQQAARYLAEAGVPAAIARQGSDIVVFVNQQFALEHKDKNVGQQERARLEETRRRVRELGKAYARKGGYAFDQCYADKY